METNWGKSRYEMEAEYVIINNDNRSKKPTSKRPLLCLAKWTALELMPRGRASQRPELIGCQCEVRAEFEGRI